MDVTTRKIDKANFEQWMEALESDDLLQCTGTLMDDPESLDEEERDMLIDLDGGEPLGMCCLGVGEFVRDPDDESWHSDVLATREFVEWLNIPIHPKTDDGKGGYEAPPAREDESVYDIGIVTKRGSKSTSGASLNDSGEPFWYIAAWMRLNRDQLVAIVN